LHGVLDANDTTTRQDLDRAAAGFALAARLARAPSIEVVDTDYGMLIGAQREAEAGQCYWRITQFHMPFYTMPPTDTTPDPVLHTHIWIPVDDAHLVEDVSEVLVCYALWVYESLSTLHPNRVTP